MIREQFHSTAVQTEWTEFRAANRRAWTFFLEAPTCVDPLTLVDLLMHVSHDWSHEPGRVDNCFDDCLSWLAWLQRIALPSRLVSVED